MTPYGPHQLISPQAFFFADSEAEAPPAQRLIFSHQLFDWSFFDYLTLMQQATFLLETGFHTPMSRVEAPRQNARYSEDAPSTRRHISIFDTPLF